MKTFPKLDYLDFFTLSPEADTREETLLEVTPENIYEHGVVVGRFQPLHYGHIFLLKHAHRASKRLTIILGSANKKNKNNPFTVEEREWMLNKAIKREGLKKIDRIIPINDNPDDNIWLADVDKQVGAFDVVFGNNDYVNNLFTKRGTHYHDIVQLQRGLYQGDRIREFLRQVGKL